MEIKQFLKNQNEKIRELSINCSTTYWDASISGEKQDYDKYNQAIITSEEFFNNKENFEKIKEFLKLEELEDIEKRQLTLLKNMYLGSQGDLDLLKQIAQLSTKIENQFNTFRAEINDKKLTTNEIKEILLTSKDNKELETAWKASKKNGKLVEKDLLNLVKLRNQLAKSLGFNNFYEMSFELSEQNIDETESLFENLINETQNSYQEVKNEIDEYLSKKFSISKSELKPWHYHDLFFQEGPQIYNTNLNDYYKKDVINIAKNYYNSLEINVENILKRSSLYEQSGKCEHAYCIDIDRDEDVRIFQNTKNNEKWMDTTLHELGHAIYCKHLNQELPFILKDSAHTFTTEAIALLFGRNSKNEKFIENYTEKSLGDIKENVQKELRLRQLVFSRWCQVMFYFEKELYKNPDQNLNKLWWNLVKKYQLIDFISDEPDWASKFHLVSAPVYYHNYLLGELLASQLKNYIKKTFSPKNSDYSNELIIGKYLIEKIFNPGKSVKWDQLITEATGEPLNPKHFINEFN